MGELLSQTEVVTSIDYGQIYFYGWEIEEPGLGILELASRALQSPERLAGDGWQMVVLSPHRNNFDAHFSVERWSAEPPDDLDEWEEADAALRTHPDVIAALAKRGITDMSLVFMDVWTYGAAVIPEHYRDRRIGWSDTWLRASAGANHRPRRLSARATRKPRPMPRNEPSSTMLEKYDRCSRFAPSQRMSISSVKSMSELARNRRNRTGMRASWRTGGP